MSVLNFLIYFSSLSFIFFGIGCFLAPRMKLEFERYGLGMRRRLVGALQLLGASGLLLGYYYSNILAMLSAGGLCLLMILGFGVRLKIRDSFLQSIPAFFYALLNAYIVFELLK